MKSQNTRKNYLFMEKLLDGVEVEWKALGGNVCAGLTGKECVPGILRKNLSIKR